MKLLYGELGVNPSLIPIGLGGAPPCSINEIEYRIHSSYIYKQICTIIVNIFFTLKCDVDDGTARLIYR